MKILLLPFAILAAVAAFFGGVGIEQMWMEPARGSIVYVIAYLASTALHLAWIIPAAKGGSAVLIILAWIVSFHFCRAGFSAADSSTHPALCSFLAETIPLLIALALKPKSSWGGRLACWRRSRAEIAVQARLGEGLFPWISLVTKQLLTGAASAPTGDYRRFTAELADAEHRLRIRLRHTVLPEQIRQSILSSACELVGQAEAAAARAGFDLERSALAAVAFCHEQLEALDNITPEHRAVLAAQCESIFLDLIAPACQALRPAMHSASKEGVL